MKLKTFLFVLTLLFGAKLSAQDQISLTDVEKVKDHLELSEDQYTFIKKTVDKINSILSEDKKILAGLKERFKNGDEPGFFEKIKVKRGRDNRADQIEELLEEIEDQLNDAQKNKFENIAKPTLKPLSKKELTE